MESRKPIAIQKHDKGYNCAQAVATTYEDLVDMSEAQLFRLTEGMGFGMGNASGTCGALSGAVVLAGLLNSSANLDHPDSKADTYKKSRQLMERFKERNGSVICGQLKGIGTGKVLRKCPDCIMDACEFFEELYDAEFKKDTSLNDDHISSDDVENHIGEKLYFTFGTFGQYGGWNVELVDAYLDKFDTQVAVLKFTDSVDVSQEELQELGVKPKDTADPVHYNVGDTITVSYTWEDDHWLE